MSRDAVIIFILIQMCTGGDTSKLIRESLIFYLSFLNFIKNYEFYFFVELISSYRSRVFGFFIYSC